MLTFFRKRDTLAGTNIDMEAQTYRLTMCTLIFKYASNVNQ